MNQMKVQIQTDQSPGNKSKDAENNNKNEEDKHIDLIDSESHDSYNSSLHNANLKLDANFDLRDQSYYCKDHVKSKQSNSNLYDIKLNQNSNSDANADVPEN